MTVPTATEIFSAPGTVASQRRDEPKWKYVVPMFVAGSLLATPASVLGTGSRVSSAEAIMALQARILQTGTQSARFVDASTWVEHDFAASLRQLQQRSGLTWGEIARSLGVSRRAVHHWASGKRVSDRHAQRIEALGRLIQNHAAATAEMTRGALLALRPDGYSALGLFERESEPRRSTPLSTLSVGEFLGAPDVVESAPVVRPSRSSRVAPRAVPRTGRDGTS